MLEADSIDAALLQIITIVICYLLSEFDFKHFRKEVGPWPIAGLEKSLLRSSPTSLQLTVVIYGGD